MTTISATHGLRNALSAFYMLNIFEAENKTIAVPYKRFRQFIPKQQLARFHPWIGPRIYKRELIASEVLCGGTTDSEILILYEKRVNRPKMSLS